MRIGGVWLALALVSAVFAQETEPVVMRVTVNLVQVDAVVTDKQGRSVPDLEASDFEILQDGKSQKVTRCAYIPTGVAPRVTTTTTTPATPAAPAPAVKAERANVHRTIAVVVDDLGISFENMFHVRNAVKSFVDEQTRPDDLVAIVRTAGDVGNLQQFTTDRRRLYAAIDRLHWYWNGRVGKDPIAGIPTLPIKERRSSEYYQFMLNNVMDTIRKLTTVVNGLRDLPGHKTVVLFSEWILLPTDFDPAANPLETAYQRLMDLTTRAGVTLYTIDARGLPTLAFAASERNPVPTASGSVNLNGNLRNIGTARAERSYNYMASQSGMRYLADETGGKFLHDYGDLNAQVATVMKDLQGYYLLGYTPAENTFTERKLHKISVRVKRSGLTVRSQSRFFSEDDRARTAPTPGSTAEMVASMLSPFEGGDIAVEASSAFLQTGDGPGITTVMNVGGSGLTFRETPDGYEANAEIAIIAFGDNGTVAAQRSWRFARTLSRTAYERVMKDGLQFTARTPVKDAGMYDVRVAVRDKASSKLGTAGQPVMVPNLKLDQLSVSGILLATNEVGDDYGSETALRVFRLGQTIKYRYQLLALPKNVSEVEAVVRLYRDGKEISTEKPVALKSPAGSVPVETAGEVKIGPELRAGDYVLESTVSCPAAKCSPVKQWTDFRVME